MNRRQRDFHGHRSDNNRAQWTSRPAATDLFPAQVENIYQRGEAENRSPNLWLLSVTSCLPSTSTAGASQSIQ